ncbi:DsbA family protein [Roseicitreum antarcticum]|uniref:Protein-disulfide isomerase n=1 Tax=Roseicitreum antarcticum TaxID=564137 RepID=A0A1H2ZWS6_9RHOB|nr:DsbA family protein [Roseicitreum antarcticum]SDX21816.1 Protein-disulfide isomerase [Roseicitreum antarcticum]
MKEFNDHLLVVGGSFAAAALIMLAAGTALTPAPTPAVVEPAVIEAAGTNPAAPSSTEETAIAGLDRAAFGTEVRRYLLDNPEVIFEAVAEYERRTTAQQGEMDATLVEINYDAIFNDGHSWVGGNPDGDITLVEFMDYQCSFCRRAHPEVLQLLEQDGNIRFIVKEFPILGPQSEVASRFAIAVHQLGGDDAYQQAHDAMMELEGAVTNEALDEIAAGLNLDLDAVQARMNADEVTTIIEENRALAQRLQISGTPTFVLESELLRGFMPADAMQQVADDLRG